MKNWNTVVRENFISICLSNEDFVYYCKTIGLLVDSNLDFFTTPENKSKRVNS